MKKKEYEKPIVETIGIDLLGLIATSPGEAEGNIGEDSPVVDDGGAAKGIFGDCEW